MPIKLLKQVISQFRKEHTCPFCKAKFKEQDIIVLMANGLSSLFFVVCGGCASQAFVSLELIPAQSPEDTFRLRMQMTSGDEISHNEILDMRNFLNSWQGDLKDIV
ncbi:hypothetical protein COV82_03140 [Candidatus Peregrinibacteria bacterium CG11_big_fil_rev_8_21_14_0_20_46_8]|nr:MAG: hypothetical protein COV82_03140 [Candidatus Peregrinibacteria bacterium CG11_big_fil_rev_8_21_14_0_20_46_8]